MAVAALPFLIEQAGQGVRDGAVELVERGPDSLGDRLRPRSGHAGGSGQQAKGSPVIPGGRATPATAPHRVIGASAYTRMRTLLRRAMIPHCLKGVGGAPSIRRRAPFDRG
jgi:hypothetical protein